MAQTCQLGLDIIAGMLPSVGEVLSGDKFWAGEQVPPMTTTEVQVAMARLRELGPRPLSLVHRRGEPFPATFALAPPISWDRHELETGLGATIPPDLSTFWDHAGGARLFVDAEYGQWGLAL